MLPTAWLMRHSNNNRCNSIVRYESLGQDDQLQSASGQVLLFFELSMEKENEARTWSSSAKRTSIQKAGRCIWIIHTQSIKELVGMNEWEERQYFLNQKTSLILPCA